MKIILETSLLSELIDISSKFIAKSSTLPILQNISLSVINNELTIKATDMEKYILINLPVDTNDEGGITVDAKTFLEIIKIIDDEQIEITVNTNDTLNISSTKDTFTIKWLPIQEFVALPEVKEPKHLSIPVSQLSTGISKVEFAVLEKNFSPVFTGVVMTNKQEDAKTNRLIFVGTDSYRLAEYKTRYDGNFEEFKLIIPKSAINDIKRVADYILSKGQNNNVEIHYANNMVMLEFSIGNMTIKTNSLLIQGNFPDYDNEKIVPRTFATTITVDSASIEKAIRKISILTKDNNNFIHLVSQNSSLEITSGTTDLWQANTSTNAIIDGTEVDVGLNGKHINDFIKQVSGDRLNLQFVNNTSPIVMTDPEVDGYKYVIRPVK